ncbi:tRNA-ribosyltransferase family protein [Limosilactobacillus balticus]|uniref:Queuine tRNA-ribosyltransferase family protein n=1 Tax=Limosilactobacillus balticus TaxID=2759747 RepID=A0ABS8R9X4_9LACO|nr:tRNA guanosine(34) transglycosylase Tgt [Limosilactobacillus balticus]MBB1128176.1 queuine tRNA-ribosyltransferase family protein [Limosilactobacillus balticus]MCD7137826.1 queuine tRNA-ribosyltransferase family protein [Limosilactobacillus balticus]
MSKLEFTINQNDRQARTGLLQVNGRQIETPALVASGDELAKLSPSQLNQAGVSAVKTSGLKRWLKYDSVTEKLGDLHQLFQWDGLLFVDLETEEAYRLAKPRGKKHDGVRFHDPVTGQLKFWQPETALQIQEVLGADIFQSFDQATDYYAPVDDLKAGVKQTNDWLSVVVSQKEEALGSIVGGGLKDLRTASIEAVDEAGLSGYRLSGIPSNLDDQEFSRIINEITPKLAEQKLRYLPAELSFDQMLVAILAGVDLIDSNLAAKKAANGIALVNQGGAALHLERQHFSFDSQALDRQCACATCHAGYSRALIHSLITNHSFYGEQLLLQHNLFTLNKLMSSLRQAIKNHQTKKFVQELLQNQ